MELDWDPDYLSDKPPVEGPPIPITIDMVKKAISQTRRVQSTEPIRHTGGYKQPVTWAPPSPVTSQLQSFTMARYPPTGSIFIVCLYKAKGDALKRGNQCHRKLTEPVIKLLHRIVDSLIRQLVSINDSQFCFSPGRGTTDIIFVVGQLQKKYLAAKKEAGFL